MQKRTQGFALISTLMMLAVMTLLYGAYQLITQVELATTRSTKESVSGFYAAEAGLNIRAANIRTTFVGFNTPTGTSPNEANACEGANDGDGDFQCLTESLGSRDVDTYVLEAPDNPQTIQIPPGEQYQNLNAQEYRYTAVSQSKGPLGGTEAILELRFRSRLVPLFQFAAFYDKDLEILPGPAMVLAGPVHTNGDLYLNANTSMQINGQVSTANNLYRGRKDNTNTPNCNSTPVQIYDPVALRSLYPACPTRRLITPADAVPYNKMIQLDVEPVTVPGPEVFDPTTGAIYWDRADLRLVLNLTNTGALNTTNAPTGIEVRDSANALDSAATNALHACAGSISGRPIGALNVNPANLALASSPAQPAMYNRREAKWLRLLDVDMQALLNCLHSTNWFASGKLLSDQTEGGLVFHFSVSGPLSAVVNNYGFRVRNASNLRSSIGGAPAPRGLTIVSNQAAYTLGHYNSVNKIPAAIMADTLNVLSGNWLDTNSAAAIGSRLATPTTMNAAILSGTDTSGGVEGSGGQNSSYNGGLENQPRFHEDWNYGGTVRTFTYRGSWVSLNRPRYSNGAWSAQSYDPPRRDWNYDTSFNSAANLPPITPRFVYLRQELFVRRFEQ
jgi:hypothetical protein